MIYSCLLSLIFLALLFCILMSFFSHSSIFICVNMSMRSISIIHNISISIFVCICMCFLMLMPIFIRINVCMGSIFVVNNIFVIGRCLKNCPLINNCSD